MKEREKRTRGRDGCGGGATARDGLARSCDAGEGGQTESMIPKRCSKGACESEKNKKMSKISFCMILGHLGSN
jgi:hypothetical protein